MSEKKIAWGDVAFVAFLSVGIIVTIASTGSTVFRRLGITLEEVRKWLELISFACAPIVTLAALFALRQVRSAVQQATASLAQTKLLLEQVEVSRQDIMLRSRREALSLALEQCKRFAKEIIPSLDTIQQKVNSTGYKPPTEVNSAFPFIPAEHHRPTAEIWVKDVPLRKEIINVLNEMESFAMYFACDLADEEIAFTPLGQTFCFACEFYAGFIGVFRQEDKVKLYQNLVKLYGTWKPRLERTVLQEQSKALDQKMKSLPADRPSKPIGTSLS